MAADLNQAIAQQGFPGPQNESKKNASASKKELKNSNQYQIQSMRKKKRVILKVEIRSTRTMGRWEKVVV